MATFVRTQSLAHPIGERGRLELRVTSADVQVAAIPGDLARINATFRIRAESDEEADRLFASAQLQPHAGSRSLELSETGQGGGGLASAIGRLLGGQRVELSVSVELPGSAELRLSTVSGDVRGTGLRGEQRYETVSGDLFLGGAGGELRINTVSGDVSVRGEAAVGLRAETISGDLSVIAPRIVGLRANAVSGDLEVEGELEADGEFRAETVSGDLVLGPLGDVGVEVRGLSTDISSDLDHRIEGRLDRRRVIVGRGIPAFLFSSMSGDLAIRRPRRLGRLPERPVAESQLGILRALERGEIDVAEAERRLARERNDA